MDSSILDEIRKLREHGDLNINRKNSNRYRLLVRENDRSNTAYYFSTPIYGDTSRKLVDPRFYYDGNSFSAEGSNTHITANKNEVVLKNKEGGLCLSWGEQQYSLQDRHLISDGIELRPTLNGVAVKAKRTGSEGFRIYVSADKPFINIRANTKYFALMSGEFKPFMTISAMGTSEYFDRICSHATISYQKIDDKRYIVDISSVSTLCGGLLFEINLYEPKLFQDTTVESKNANENNAFGSIAFVGDSEAFGEQWLYTRLDFSVISEIIGREIKKIQLHIPRYNESAAVLAGFEVAQRFCSFGSNWESKKAFLSNKASESSVTQNYQNIDITNFLVNSQTYNLNVSEGLILKSKVKGSGFSVIATGDNYYTPQILEINFNDIKENRNDQMDENSDFVGSGKEEELMLETNAGIEMPAADALARIARSDLPVRYRT